MKKTVTIQDFIDALGMEGLLTTIDGQQSCAALMALYSDADLKEAAGRAVSGVTYNSLEAGEGSLFVCKGAHFKEQYLEDAVAKGAVCFVREDPDAAEAVSCSLVGSGEEAAAAAGIKNSADRKSVV